MYDYTQFSQHMLQYFKHFNKSVITVDKRIIKHYNNSITNGDLQ